MDHILAGFQQDFPVVDNARRIMGILTRTDLVKALAQRGQEAPLTEAMQRRFETADPAEMAEQVFARLQDCQLRFVRIDWGLTAAFLAVALLGMVAGVRLARRLSPTTLRRAFAWSVIVLGAVLLASNLVEFVS